MSLFGKTAHISIDDVQNCFQRLEHQKLSSIFEDPFFAYLQMLHNKYGCKFSLYCYSDALKMLIHNLCYFDELRMNCHWLMIGFHAERGLGKLPSNRTMEQFKTSFQQFLNIIDIGNLPFCKVLRLEFFYASQEEVFFLKKNGIECLLCADDSRISYNLL